MNPAPTAVIGLALSLPALHFAASVDTPPSLMSRVDHAVELRVIQDGARLALARCRAVDPSYRAVCRAEARANERIAIAALEVRYRGTLAAQERALREQARALHTVGAAHRLSPDGA